MDGTVICCWQVSYPVAAVGATADEVADAFRAAVPAAATVHLAVDVRNRGGYAFHPHAFVTWSPPVAQRVVVDASGSPGHSGGPGHAHAAAPPATPAATTDADVGLTPPVFDEAALLANGMTLLGQLCRVKRRRTSRKDRLRDIAVETAAVTAAAAAREAARPAWRPDEMLGRFKMRESTLDHHVQVSRYVGLAWLGLQA